MRQHAWSRSFRYWEWCFALATGTVTAMVWFGADSTGTALAASAWIAALVLWYFALGRRLLTTDLSVTGMDGRLSHVYRLGVLALVVPLGLTDRDAMLILAPVISHLFWFVPLRPTIPVVLALNFVPALAVAADREPLEKMLPAVSLCAFTAVASIAFGVFIHRVIDQSVERFELIEELEDSRSEVARLSHEAGVTAERQRLAAELHDTVTQGLSSIVMLAQAARTTGNDLERRKHLSLIERTARANLTEARSMVEALATEETTTVEAEAALADLAEKSGAKFKVDGVSRTLRPETAVVLVRAVQEALRNTDKHAPGAAVQVNLTYRESDVLISITDDGPGFDPEAPPAGFGLRGIRNRVIGLGGAFQADSAPDEGTTIRLEVPA